MEHDEAALYLVNLMVSLVLLGLGASICRLCLGLPLFGLGLCAPAWGAAIPPFVWDHFITLSVSHPLCEITLSVSVVERWCWRCICTKL